MVDFNAAAEESGGKDDSSSSDIIEKQQSEVMSVEDRPEDDGGDSWKPSMASSPEATMLDDPDNEDEDDFPTKQVLESALDRLRDNAKEESLDRLKEDTKEEDKENIKEEVKQDSLEKEPLSKKGVIASSSETISSSGEQSK